MEEILLAMHTAGGREERRDTASGEGTGKETSDKRQWTLAGKVDSGGKGVPSSGAGGAPSGDEKESRGGEEGRRGGGTIASDFGTGRSVSSHSALAGSMRRETEGGMQESPCIMFVR